MKTEQFMGVMESFAPKNLALDFDNVGLLVGNERGEVKKVLVALDCTVEVAKEAVAGGYDTVLSHHPIFFHGVKCFLPNYHDTAAAFILVRNNIALFAAHTNYDAAISGVNDTLCEILGVVNTVVVPPENLCRVGDLVSPLTMRELLQRVCDKLNTRVRYVANDDIDTKIIRRVAITGGASSADTYLVKNYGADCFITGEVKHNVAIDAKTMDLCIIEAGHFATENITMQPLMQRLIKACPDVTFTMSESKSPLTIF